MSNLAPSSTRQAHGELKPRGIHPEALSDEGYRVGSSQHDLALDADGPHMFWRSAPGLRVRRSHSPSVGRDDGADHSFGQ